MEKGRFISSSIKNYWDLPKIFAVFICFFAGHTTLIAAVDPVLRVDYFQDSTNQLTIEQVSSPLITPQFRNTSAINFNFGLSPDTYWLKISVQRTDHDPEGWYLEVDHPPLDTLEFYSQTPRGDWNQEKAGDKVHWHEQRFRYRRPLFHFRLHDTLPHTYYLKVKSLGVVQIPLKIYAENEMLSRVVRSEFTEGLYYGAMLLMILYNLFLFFSLKENSYLFYCLFVLCNTLMIAGLQGHLVYYLFPQNLWDNRVLFSSIFAALFWGQVFAGSFLHLRYFSSRLYFLLRGFAIVSGISIVLPFVVPFKVFFILAVLLVVSNPLLVSWSGIVAWKRGKTSARLFVYAWLLYFLSAILICLRSLGWVTDHIRFESIMQIGSLVEVLLLSFALADQINLYRAEKIKAQKEALQASLENEQIVRNQNLMLEERIRERTQEVSVKNEELLSQHEAIEELNHQLISLNQDLEEQVIERTNEILSANERLTKQNSRLEQFANIVSHNIRGPVAQILGVVNILDYTNLTEHNHQCIGHLGQVTQRLDTVIKDLNQSLIYRNTADYKPEEVSIRHLLDSVLDKMQQLLLAENVRIRNDLDSQVKLYAIKSYLQDILEQLIGNAIKYQSEERDTEIHFSSQQQDQQFVLLIADNGIGIDLEKYQEKVFGLYQRFHLHREGRGVGLYLAKTQIEAMGGKIEVESVVGQGTAFKLHLSECVSFKSLIHSE